MIAITINAPITMYEISMAMVDTPSAAETPASNLSSRKNSETTARTMASTAKRGRGDRKSAPQEISERPLTGGRLVFDAFRARDQSLFHPMPDVDNHLIDG